MVNIPKVGGAIPVALLVASIMHVCAGQKVNCSKTMTFASSGGPLTCAAVANYLKITTQTLQSLNPSVNCQKALASPQPLCVAGQAVTATTTTSKAVSSPGSTVVKNVPISTTSMAASMSTSQITTATSANVTRTTSTSAPSTHTSTPVRLTHVVKKGEYCYLIATQAGISLADLYAYNPGINCDALQPGQVLYLSPATPSSTTATTSTTGTATATTTKSATATTTSVIASSTVQATATPTPTTPTGGACATYVVKSGDTCWAIANSYKVGLSTFLGWNPGVDCSNLQIGQVLCVSAGTPTSSPTRPPASTPTPVPGRCGIQSGTNAVRFQNLFWDHIFPRWLTHYQTCPLNVCCSAAGYCGTTPEFCYTGCQSNCGLLPPPDSRQCSNSMQISVGYYSSWAATRACPAAVIPEDLDPLAYTHLHFAFATITSDSKLAMGSTADANILARVVQLKARNPSLKVLLSVGGWGPETVSLSRMASSSLTRSTFITSTLALLDQSNLDGLDIDWEYPGIAETGGMPQDAGNFVLLAQELRRAMGSKYLLAFTTPATYYNLQYFQLQDLIPQADYMVAMTYDLHGSWDYLGGQGVLNAHTNLTEVSSALNLIMKAGVPSNKLLMGLGYYGRSFKMAKPNCAQPGCPMADPIANPPTPGTCGTTDGIVNYSELVQMIQSDQYTSLTTDTAAAVKIMTYGAQSWISFDDASTIATKMAKARDLCLGGTGSWAIDLEPQSHDLSNAVKAGRLSSSLASSRVFRRYAILQN